VSTELPDPLVPAEVDLRGLDYMPMLGNHLFGSEFNAAASDSEWRAALTLWWAAWNQVPAGSLPSDDNALCRLADLGRDLKTWRKLKTRAMHGFIACVDGRYYHEFLCRQVMIAWDKRVKERQRKAAWRKTREGTGSGQDADVPRDKTDRERGRDGSVPADGNRRDVTGRDDVGIPSVGVPTAASAAPPTSVVAIETAAAKPVTASDRVWAIGVPLFGSTAQARGFVGRLVKTYDAELLASVLAETTATPPSGDLKAWVIAACEARKTSAAQANGGNHGSREEPDLLRDPHPDWALQAGFVNRFEAENEGCYKHNAAGFRDGKRITQA
jgi:hypothetical protein